MALPQFGFVWLAMPKCASTSVEGVLEDAARLVLRGPLKHTNALAFHNRVQPVLSLRWERDSYETACLFREPISWLESWWRYRSGDNLRGRPQWTGDQTFAQWLHRYVDRDPALQRLGRQAQFVAGPGGTVGVDRIFRYESPEVWQAWLTERMSTPVETPIYWRNWVTRTLGLPLEFPQRNVSVQRAEHLDSGLRREAEQMLAPEYDIYAQLGDGQWTPPEGYLTGL